jgi:Tol biopolymer transport system component
VNLAGDPDSVVELWKSEMAAEQARNFADTSRPNWSADGLEIIYTDNTSGKCVLKRVATSGDGAPVEVAPALTHLDVHAVWSPDRKRIAFTSTQPPGEIPKLKVPLKK